MQLIMTKRWRWWKGWNASYHRMSGSKPGSGQTPPKNQSGSFQNCRSNSSCPGMNQSRWSSPDNYYPAQEEQTRQCLCACAKELLKRRILFIFYFHFLSLFLFYLLSLTFYLYLFVSVLTGLWLPMPMLRQIFFSRAARTRLGKKFWEKSSQMSKRQHGQD